MWIWGVWPGVAQVRLKKPYRWGSLVLFFSLGFSGPGAALLLLGMCL